MFEASFGSRGLDNLSSVASISDTNLPARLALQCRCPQAEFTGRTVNALTKLFNANFRGVLNVYFLLHLGVYSFVFFPARQFFPCSCLFSKSLPGTFKACTTQQPKLYVCLHRSVSYCFLETSNAIAPCRRGPEAGGSACDLLGSRLHGEAILCAQKTTRLRRRLGAPSSNVLSCGRVSSKLQVLLGMGRFYSYRGSYHKHTLTHRVKLCVSYYRYYCQLLLTVNDRASFFGFLFGCCHHFC